MDRNIILAMALSLAVFSVWLAWQGHVHKEAQLKAGSQAPSAAMESPGQHEAPTAAAGSAGAAAGTESEHVRKAAEAATTGPATPSREIPSLPSDTPQSGPVWSGALETSSASGELTNLGGGLRSWRLHEYFETPAHLRQLDVLGLGGSDEIALATPFDDLGLGDLRGARYEIEHADASGVTFVLRRGGVTIRKTYRVDADHPYGFVLELTVSNATERSLSSRYEFVWPARTSGLADFREVSVVALSGKKVHREAVVSVGSKGFFGRLFGGGKKDEGPTTYDDVKWAGVDVRYFAGVLKPESGPGAEVRFEPLEPRKVAATYLYSDPVTIAPGHAVTRSYEAFLGPKQPALLEAMGDSWPELIYRGYSWVAPLTSFFGWALHSLYAFIPNYGLAIIVITMLVRVASWPIVAKQMRSSERMRELMPRVKEIQEKFKDDRQRQSEETFKLYRETGVNPLGGCLPMLLQMPVFIGLFYALQSSIDLRQAPFALWINDLSSPATAFMLPVLDFPVRILPLLMAASMYAQQKMTPQTGVDPAQARMMLVMMPGMMLLISYGFPSGLVLYWMVSNLLGIGHQLLIRRRMQAGR